MKRIFVLFFLFFFWGTIPVLARDEKIVAQLWDQKMTEADFNRIISYYDQEKQKILEQNPQAKVTLLKRLIEGIVISKMAKDERFDQRPEIKEQIELIIQDFLATEYIKKKVIADIDVSEEDMKIFYKAHVEDYSNPLRVRARHILVSVGKSASAEDKKKSLEKAKEILKKIREGEDFDKLASEFSDDQASKKKGGDLGFFSKGKMHPQFEDVVFSMKPGEVSDIVETPFGFHIIRLEERKEPATEPFEKVKDQIRERMLSELRKVRVSEFIERAFKDAGVQINAELFGQGNPSITQ